MAKKSITNPDGSYIKLIKEAPQYDMPPQGEAIGICPECGQKFDQLLMTEKNCYSSFRKCPSCRHKKKGDDLLADAEIMRVTLDYTPHPAQQKFHDSKARFRVLNCGSRFGKDRSSTMESITYYLACLNEDRDTSMIPSVYWWIIAPTERMAKQNWNELKRYFPKELVVDVSNSGMMLQTVYGGLIEIRSAYDPESLVGVGLDIVTITEAARIADLDIVWANLEQRLNSPGRGLEGKGGIGIINSSPKGRNYFHKMYTWGQTEHPDYDPDWESWTFTTWDNPAMAVKGEEIKLVRGHPLTYKERLKRRLGVSRYNQDILAMFLAGESKCFPEFMEKCVVRVPDYTPEKRAAFIRKWREPEPYEPHVIGYDPASINDYPAVLVISEVTGKMKRAYNMSGLSWNGQYNKLAQISVKYNNAPVAFSKTGHETIEEELIKRNLRCITLNEQGSNKENFVTRMEGVVEQGAFKILDDGSEENDEAIRQYCDYARIERGGKTVFGNVEEPHDDYVSAGYVAFQAITVPDDALPAMGMLVGMRV